MGCQSTQADSEGRRFAGSQQWERYLAYGSSPETYQLYHMFVYPKHILIKDDLKEHYLLESGATKAAITLGTWAALLGCHCGSSQSVRQRFA